MAEPTPDYGGVLVVTDGTGAYFVFSPDQVSAARVPVEHTGLIERLLNGELDEMPSPLPWGAAMPPAWFDAARTWAQRQVAAQ